MTVAQTKPLHVLRGILRSMKAPTLASVPSETNVAAAFQKVKDGQQQTHDTLRQNILAQYREAKDMPPEKAGLLRKMAYDYFMIRKDLQERSRLYDLDGGAETKLSPKELSRRAAARAGLQLPEV